MEIVFVTLWLKVGTVWSLFFTSLVEGWIRVELVLNSLVEGCRGVEFVFELSG